MSFASAFFVHVVFCISSSVLFMARKYSILGIPRFVYPLILNTWAVLSFWLFQTKPLWTFMYKYSIHMCFHFSCVNTVEWNGRIVSMVGFSLKELPDCFPKRLWPLHSSGFPLCYAQLLSLVQVFVISWIEACQAPLSLEFSRQEYWSGLPFSPRKDLPNSGFKTTFLISPTLEVDSLPSSH